LRRLLFGEKKKSPFSKPTFPHLSAFEAERWSFSFENPSTIPNTKAYNPTVVESAWYAWWEKEGFFIPQVQKEDGKVKDEGSFVIV